MKSTNGASECCERTSQLSLFGETCERWQPAMFATPQAHDAQGGSVSRVRRFGSKHGGRNLSDETVAGISPSSPQGIPASHSHSPGSDWARKMTATYGRKLSDFWLSSDPPDSWVRMLLGTSIWGSMTCYLTWRKSVTPRGRLLFRLVPQAPRTVGIASGLWGTPTSRDHKDTGNMENVPVNGLLGRQVLAAEGLRLREKDWDVDAMTEEDWAHDSRMWEGEPPPERSGGMWPTPRQEFDSGRHRGKPDTLHSAVKALTKDGLLTTPCADDTGHRTERYAQGGTALSAQVGGKLNSAWVSRMMGYPDDWLTLDGEATR